MSQRPRSVVEPITTHNSSQSELEYLEIFDFFNYPRLNAISSGVDPSAIPVDNQAAAYRATPAFVIPNPDSDWLIFKPPYE